MTLFSFFCSIIFRTLAISSVTILDLRSVIYACKSFYVSWHPFPIDDMILRKDSNEAQISDQTCPEIDLTLKEFHDHILWCTNRQRRKGC